MSVADNIANLEERIQKACAGARRKREEVTLMGVSKFVPIEQIDEAYRCGIRCFGESRVKESEEKLAAFKGEHSDASFHLIGSLQRNKAKQAALFFDCIQSADRDEIIAELAKHSPQRQSPLEILLELHTGEETKSGYQSIEALFKAAELVLESANLKLTGLMTMAPFTTDKDLVRSSFKQLAKARDELEKRFPGNVQCLSMGMSNDFEIAIEEGATLIRIGGAIFKGN